VRGSRGGTAYATFGIDPAGAVVIVRPDGYVGMIAPFDHVRDVNHYFATFTKTA
jgi:phenol 2-monooxygenase